MSRRILSCALCLGVAGSPVVSRVEVSAQARKTAPVTRARAVELFNANCQVCHGPEGTGTPLMKDLAFAGRKWKHGSRQQDVVHTITNGVPATPMLPFKDRLTPAEISALASLVRSYDKALKPSGRVKKS